MSVGEHGRGEAHTDGVETKGDIAGMHLELSGGVSLDELIGDFDALSEGPCEKGSVNVFR